MSKGAEIRNEIIDKAEELGKLIQNNSDKLPFNIAIGIAITVMLVEIDQTRESKVKILKLIEDESI